MCEATDSDKIQIDPSDKGFLARLEQQRVLRSDSCRSWDNSFDKYFHWNSVTGQVWTLVQVNDVPLHINLKTGWYKYGIRKCSVCNEFLDQSKYTDEQAKLPAAKRVCNLCLAKRVQCSTCLELKHEWEYSINTGKNTTLIRKYIACLE